MVSPITLAILAVGGILVCHKQIYELISKFIPHGESKQPAILCPACASKQIGKLGIWRGPCSSCHGACAVVPDQMDVLDNLMSQIYKPTARKQTQQSTAAPPNVQQAVDDPSLPPITLRSIEGPERMIKRPQAPHEQCAPKSDPDVIERNIGGRPAPSQNTDVEEGNMFPVEAYPGQKP